MSAFGLREMSAGFDSRAPRSCVSDVDYGGLACLKGAPRCARSFNHEGHEEHEGFRDSLRDLRDLRGYASFASRLSVEAFVARRRGVAALAASAKELAHVLDEQLRLFHRRKMSA